MNSLPKRLGQRIARQRRAAGLTQAELAEKVGVQPETISRLETGKRTVSLRVVATISESLGLELHELFRLQLSDSAKDQAMGRLTWFASRLTAAEIELILDVGSAALMHVRRAQGK
ncbi:helix-turn-helix domain-containing protein [Geothrix fuzhouensis]|uniref:helix-turn-helix domain-containing protein n=1 Tax=Geothrix fuzhouensis TaxID=2966451 RepID=UPI0021485A88|nr:helix-turn-helix transcriptional regulator [Geothrix fuzhouensis]